MTHYEEYIQGNYQGVWQSVSSAETPEETREAERVGRELMKRVRHNTETLVERLESLGFEFLLPGADKIPVVGPIGAMIQYTRETARFWPADDEDRESIRIADQAFAAMPLALRLW